MFYIKVRPNSYKRDEVDKDEGISDEEDIAELKLQLEINEQVSMLAVMRTLPRFITLRNTM